MFQFSSKRDEQFKNYFYDNNNVRYRKVRESENNPFNWLFFPGGPGADSSYLLGLTELLNFPTNIFLIDLSGNGSNHLKFSRQSNYDNWLNILLPTITRFENPIYVGHSFGGMLPLLVPKLEHYLKGLVILNSAPSLWFKESLHCIQEQLFPDYKKKLHNFIERPSLKSAQLLFFGSIPNLTPLHLKDLYKIKNTPFSWKVALWWVKKAHETHYSAEWIPQKVPTLIIGSSDDYITPFSIYERDPRFQRENIHLHTLENAGHFSWFSKANELKKIINSFYYKEIKK